MDLFTTILQLLNNPSASFIIGIAAAFTPCTLAIFPIFLYRFGLWGTDSKIKKNYTGLILASVSFILSFAITGVLLQQIIISEFANVFRLFLGTLLVFVGVLQIGGKLNLQKISGFSNPIALGASLPWIISFSPCVLAFTANLLVSGSTVSAGNTGSTILQFTLFGMGMLLPVVLLVLAGNTALAFMRKSQGSMKIIEKISPYLIIASGLYLSGQLVQITSPEVVWAGLLMIVFAVVISYYIFKNHKYRNAFNYMLAVFNGGVILVVLIVSRAIAAPYDATALKGDELLYACIPGSHQTSPVAIPLAILFSVIAISLAAWYHFHDREKRYRLDFGLAN